jgi:hypothetical protein
MNNCKWMDRVIPAFVNPYIEKTGRWKEIESDCQRPPSVSAVWSISLRDRFCARSMAKYHIEQDLAQALSTMGCGTDSDWNLVFEMIQKCSSATFNSIPYLFLSETIANWQVQSYRDAVREHCKISRLNSKLPIEININTEGKTCDPSN